MSTTLGTISSVIPPPSLAKTDLGHAAPEQDAPRSAAAPKQDPATDADAIAPVPIQPLSNRILATFMQKDIELYGSMFGA